jgi:sugar phosphate isomerase/epimerase
MVDFTAIIASLRSISYDGTMTLEVKPEFQRDSLTRIKNMVGKHSINMMEE